MGIQNNFYGVNEQTFREVVKEGSNVLIVTSFFHNQSLTTMYMLNDVKISHYTVNSTPTYGEQLLSYWERYPERKPDCIIINGDSCPAEDYQWAMELIEGYGIWSYGKSIPPIFIVNLSMSIKCNYSYYIFKRLEKK